MSKFLSNLKNAFINAMDRMSTTLLGCRVTATISETKRRLNVLGHLLMIVCTLPCMVVGLVDATVATVKGEAVKSKAVETCESTLPPLVTAIRVGDVTEQARLNVKAVFDKMSEKLDTVTAAPSTPKAESTVTDSALLKAQIDACDDDIRDVQTKLSMDMLIAAGKYDTEDKTYTVSMIDKMNAAYAKHIAALRKLASEKITAFKATKCELENKLANAA